VLARHVDAEFRQRMEIAEILEALRGANAAGQLAPTS
jgi:isochorismate synthase EntC